MQANDKVFNIISEPLGVEKESIEPDSHFYKDLNAEKLEVTDIIMRAVQMFNLEIEAEDYNKVKTVADLIDLISSHSDEL
jgi:acyl carrier protein